MPVVAPSLPPVPIPIVIPIFSPLPLNQAEPNAELSPPPPPPPDAEQPITQIETEPPVAEIIRTNGREVLGEDLATEQADDDDKDISSRVTIKEKPVLVGGKIGVKKVIKVTKRIKTIHLSNKKTAQSTSASKESSFAAAKRSPSETPVEVVSSPQTNVTNL